MFKTLLLAAAASLGLNAGAITYSNFGPGQTYTTISGYGVQSPAVGSWLGEGFVATVSGSLSQVDIPLAYFQSTAPTLPLTIALETDTSGLPSGTVLESWTVPGSSVAQTSQIFTFASVLNPTLTSGTEYWLVASTNDANGYVWLMNSLGLMGHAYNNQGDGFQIQPAAFALALDVVVGSSSTATTPEPGSAGLTGLAGILMLGAWWTRKRVLARA